MSGKSVYYECDAVLITPNNETLQGEYNGYGDIDGVDVFLLAAYDWDIEAAREATKLLEPTYSGVKEVDSADASDLRDLAALRSNAIESDEPEGSLGFKIMRASEYHGQRYEHLPVSFSCPNQGFFFGDDDQMENDVLDEFSPGVGPTTPKQPEPQKQYKLGGMSTN